MLWVDIDAVHALECDLFAEDPWTPDMFWSELAGVPETREVIVAEYESAIIGYASLRVVDDQADLNTIAVKHEFQHQGVGRLLYSWLEQVAHSRRVREIFLDVRSDNIAARVFYESEKFEQVDIRKNYYSTHIDAVVMCKRLS